MTTNKKVKLCVGPELKSSDEVLLYVPYVPLQITTHEDLMNIDKTRCSHVGEERCECVCHAGNNIIIHDRACCEPCRADGCDFRKKLS
jgi:hypothetical protein